MDQDTQSNASRLGALQAWRSTDVWRIGRRLLVLAFYAAALLYLLALAALYHWQRDMVFVRARWWHESAPPSGFVERTVREDDGTRLLIWDKRPTG